jgi:hypothetical protein
MTLRHTFRFILVAPALRAPIFGATTAMCLSALSAHCSSGVDAADNAVPNGASNGPDGAAGDVAATDATTPR